MPNVRLRATSDMRHSKVVTSSTGTPSAIASAYTHPADSPQKAHLSSSAGEKRCCSWRITPRKKQEVKAPPPNIMHTSATSASSGRTQLGGSCRIRRIAPEGHEAIKQRPRMQSGGRIACIPASGTLSRRTCATAQKSKHPRCARLRNCGNSRTCPGSATLSVSESRSI